MALTPRTTRGGHQALASVRCRRAGRIGGAESASIQRARIFWDRKDPKAGRLVGEARLTVEGPDARDYDLHSCAVPLNNLRCRSVCVCERAIDAAATDPQLLGDVSDFLSLSE